MRIVYPVVLMVCIGTEGIEGDEDSIPSGSYGVYRY